MRLREVCITSFTAVRVQLTLLYRHMSIAEAAAALYAIQVQ